MRVTSSLLVMVVLMCLTDDFSSPSALFEAAALPGAQLFVFPAGGQVEAVFVLAPDRLVWDLRTDNAAAWFEELGLRPGSVVELEAALAAWCEWVPRMFRGVVLGTETAEDLAAPRH